MSSHRQSDPGVRSKIRRWFPFPTDAFSRSQSRILILSITAGLLLYGLVLTGSLIRWSFASNGSSPHSQSDRGRQNSLAVASQHRQDLNHATVEPRISHLIALAENEDFEWLELEKQKSDRIEIHNAAEWTTLRRVCGSTGREVWERRFPSRIESGLNHLPPMTIWKCKPPASIRSQPSLRPKLIRPAPDLDGDGTGDLVWYSQEHLNGLLIAISGASGKLLWLVTDPNGSRDHYQSRPLIADVNLDGLPDVVCCVPQKTGPAIMEAIIGKDGTRQWRQSLDGFANLPSNQNQNSGFANRPRLVDLVTHRGQELIVVEDDSRIAFHSLATGNCAFDVSSLPGIRSQSTCFADFNKDGESEAILFRQHDTPELVAGLPPFTITAWHLFDEQTLWRKPLSCALAGNPSEEFTIPRTDVDNDGQDELALSNYLQSVLSIDLLDAVTCQSRWPKPHRLSRNPETSIGQILQCPDVDLDGTADLLVVSLDHAKRAQPPLALFLDLLSGIDGHSIATLSRPLSERGDERIGSVQWIPRSNQFPLLAVETSRPIHRGHVALENAKHIDVWSIWNRQLVCAITDIDRFQVCDLKGNGQASLCVSRRGIRSIALSTIDFLPRDASARAHSNGSHEDRQLPLSYGRSSEHRVLEHHDDPRWLEPLPWSTILERLDQDVMTHHSHPVFLRIEYLGHAQLAFLGIFLAPGWLVFRAFAVGQWSLGRWLLLPAVVGISIVSLSTFSALDQTRQIAMLSGFPLPLVTLLVPLISWTILLLPLELAVLSMRRQYTTIVVLLSIITVLAIVVATVWLLPVWSRMDADMRFDWNRWHWIWLITAYLTGWAYLIACTIFHWASRLESP